MTRATLLQRGDVLRQEFLTGCGIPRLRWHPLRHILALVEEGMVVHLRYRCPGRGLHLEAAVDQCPRLSAHHGGVWEGVVTHLDATLGFLDVVRLEGGFAHQKSLNDHSYRPDVDLIRVALSIKHFRGQLVRGTAYGSLLFVVLLYLGR